MITMFANSQGTNWKGLVTQVTGDTVTAPGLRWMRPDRGNQWT